MHTLGANEWFYLVALALFGLVFGSFGNVVIWRLPRGESLSHPASHCPKCDSPIEWYDNIPVVSWVLLGAKCRSCSAPISPRYPIVEGLSGLLWVSAGWRFGLTWSAAAAVVLFYVLLLLAFIDWDTMRLPNPLLAVLLGVAVAGIVASHVAGTAVVPLISLGGGVLRLPVVSAVAGAVAASGIMLAISGVYRAVRGAQGYGMGDIKLFAVLGLFLGLYSLMVMFIATVLGALYGVASAQASDEGGQHRFAFGPFIALAAVVVTLVGPRIWAWYAGLAGMRL